MEIFERNEKFNRTLRLKISTEAKGPVVQGFRKARAVEGLRYLK